MRIRLNALQKCTMTVLVTLMTLLVGANSARAEETLESDPISRVMRLRLEVEEKNVQWEQEKKRLQSEYEAVLSRTSEVQSEVLRKRSQLEVLRAREAAAEKRTERRQTVSGVERKVLAQTMAEVKLALDETLPIGRKENHLRILRLNQDLSEGRGSVDEFASDLAQAVKSELKLSRGVHLVKEELEVESEKVAVEAARIGGYAAFFASTDGRVGEWNRLTKKSSWVTDSQRKKLLLAQLELVRKAASSHRPVLLDLDLESK